MKQIVPFILVLAACGDIDLNNFTGSGVSGDVNGKSFSDAAASAENNGDGSYVITLADTFEFDCSSTDGLPDTYLTVVIGDVSEAPIELDAANVVFFNDFENGVANGDSATTGTVTIDEIGSFSISGSLNASSATSSVSGSFSADICN